MTDEKNVVNMHTEIVCVIDRSGSMERVRDDVIGGFNAFLKEQKDAPGTANLTYTQFDTEYEVIHAQIDIQNVLPLDQESYIPRGGTALLDAIGRTVNDALSKMKDKKVIFVIITDGEENSSKEFTSRDKIFEMITKGRDELDWEFIFLGADQDAIKEAASYGVPAANAMAYSNTSAGTRASYTSASLAVNEFRTSGNIGNWKGDTTTGGPPNLHDSTTGKPEKKPTGS